MAGVAPVALRRPHVASGRWRARWRRGRRALPGGGWGLAGVLAMALCLLVWHRAGGPDALGDWIGHLARAVLAFAARH